MHTQQSSTIALHLHLPYTTISLHHRPPLQSSTITTTIFILHYYHPHPSLPQQSPHTTTTIIPHHNNHHSLPLPLLSHTTTTITTTTDIHPLHHYQDPKQLAQSSHITTTTLKSKLVSVDKFPGECSRAGGPFEDQVYTFCNYKFLCNLIYPEAGCHLLTKYSIKRNYYELNIPTSSNN